MTENSAEGSPENASEGAPAGSVGNLYEKMKALEDLLEKLKSVGAPEGDSYRKIHERANRAARTYATPSLAIEICDNMFADAVQTALDQGLNEEMAKMRGKLAYCAVMPKLTGATNVRDFIACVTYAMSLEILGGSEGTRLLYAAQVAHTALTKRPKKRNKSSHTSTKPPETNPTQSTN